MKIRLLSAVFAMTCILMAVTEVKAIDVTLASPGSVTVKVIPIVGMSPRPITKDLDLDPGTATPDHFFNGTFTNLVTCRIKVYDTVTGTLLTYADFRGGAYVTIDYNGTNWNVHQ